MTPCQAVLVAIRRQIHRNVVRVFSVQQLRQYELAAIMRALPLISVDKQRIRNISADRILQLALAELEHTYKLISTNDNYCYRCHSCL